MHKQFIPTEDDEGGQISQLEEIFLRKTDDVVFGNCT